MHQSLTTTAIVFPKSSPGFQEARFDGLSFEEASGLTQRKNQKVNRSIRLSALGLVGAVGADQPRDGGEHPGELAVGLGADAATDLVLFHGKRKALIHIYIYICIHISICICVYVYNVFIYVHIYIYIYIYICLSTCVYTYIYIYDCIFAGEPGKEGYAHIGSTCFFGNTDHCPSLVFLGEEHVNIMFFSS